MAEWVLACLQRKVFSGGGGGGGGGGSSQVVLSIWLSLFITEIFYFPCHHLEEGFNNLAGNLGANNEYFSLRVTFLLLLKTLIRERLLIRPNTPIVISLHHRLKSFFCKKRSSHFHPELQDILHMIHHDHRHNHVIDLRLNSDGPQGPVWSWVELLLGTTHHNPFLRLGFKFTWKGKKITFQFFIFYLLVWTHHNPFLRLWFKFTWKEKNNFSSLYILSAGLNPPQPILATMI